MRMSNQRFTKNCQVGDDKGFCRNGQCDLTALGIATGKVNNGANWCKYSNFKMCDTDKASDSCKIRCDAAGAGCKALDAITAAKRSGGSSIVEGPSGFHSPPPSSCFS